MPRSLAGAIEALLMRLRIQPIPALRGESADDSGARLPVPGTRVAGKIQERLPDGSFKVAVAGRMWRMSLPSGAAPGDRIELAYLSDKPRPTFLLLDSAVSFPRASLSSAARLIGSLLPTTEKGAAVATGLEPLLPAPPGEARELAAALSRALAYSGLFYESHQAQWVAGVRPLSDLLKEPQGQIPPAAEPEASNEGKSALPSLGDSEPQVRIREHGRGDPATALARNQLAALDSRAILWRGEAWPGQPMEWEITEEPPERSEREAPLAWRTRITLTFPRLGKINARLRMERAGVSLEVACADPESARLLNAHRGTLYARLSAADLPLRGMAVRHEAP